MDGFVFSSGLVATVGAALSLVASLVLDAPDARSWALLTACGTFIIYNLDRLRDLDRDRSTSPLRTSFVLRNRRLLSLTVAIASLGFATTLLTVPLSISLLCAAIGLVGLLHRRLKAVSALKTLYVSLAWVAACVGMPWLVSERADGGAWLAGILLVSLTANLIASNLRDEEAEVVRESTMPMLWLARAMTVLAIGIATAAPTPLLALGWIPLCEGLALVRFEHSERYGLVAVDGALLLGALATSIQLGSTL
jgi:putative Mn2+ efflux pump MntP